MDPRRRRPMISSSVAAVAAFAMLAAGCGGGGSPRVASVATSTSVAGTTVQDGPVAFARCMRSHGIPNWPDPTGNGGFDKSKLLRLGVSGTKIRSLEDGPCSHLLPAAPSENITRADQVDYLKAAACMRRHGIPAFPDPVFQNGGVKFNIPSSINPNSPKVVSALPICRKLIPAGLPYSGTN